MKSRLYRFGRYFLAFIFFVLTTAEGGGIPAAAARFGKKPDCLVGNTSAASLAAAQRKRDFLSSARFSMDAGMPASADGEATEAPEITVAIARLNTGWSNGDEIERKLDEYIFSSLGFHLNVEYLDYLYSGQMLGRYLLDGSFPDVFLVTDYREYMMLQEEGYLYPLDSLLSEYGQELTEAVKRESVLSHTDSSGAAYAIPCIHTRAYASGFEYRKSYAEKYGLDMESVHTPQDLTDIFRELKQRDPDAIPVTVLDWSEWDPMWDSLGVIMDYGRSDHIENLYETERYTEICRLLGEWREAGYMLDEDIVQAGINAFVSVPEIFGKLADYNPSMQYMDEIEAGEEIGTVVFSDTVLRNNAYERNLWVISSGSSHPEEAMRFLNALYTDPAIANLLAYGIEHENYEFLDREQGTIRFPDEAPLNEKNYPQIRTYLVGNQYLCYLWDNCPTDLWQQCINFDKEAVLSEGYGFMFNMETVARQIHDCLEIQNKYVPYLRYGAKNSDKILVAFREELKEAGIDEIIEEKQRQFSLWKTGGGK